MFIHKVKDEEVLELLNGYLQGFYLIKQSLKVDRSRENALIIYVTAPNGTMKMITFNDFNVATDNGLIDTVELKSVWIDFMCKKFDKEYKNAYNENLEQKYESELLK